MNHTPGSTEPKIRDIRTMLTTYRPFRINAIPTPLGHTAMAILHNQPRHHTSVYIATHLQDSDELLFETHTIRNRKAKVTEQCCKAVRADIGDMVHGVNGWAPNPEEIDRGRREDIANALTKMGWMATAFWDVDPVHVPAYADYVGDMLIHQLHQFEPASRAGLTEAFIINAPHAA